MSTRLGSTRCAELAAIVGGTPAFMEGVCLIQSLRADLSPTILGVETRSPLVLPVFFTVEQGDDQGRTLNLGEAVLLQEETQTVMRVLRENGIIVTALHNHWLFERPRLMYMHWEALMDPVRFLEVSRAALRAANVRTRPVGGGRDDDSTGHAESESRSDHRSDSGHRRRGGARRERRHRS